MTVEAAVAPAVHGADAPPPPWLRSAVRDLLLRAPGYADLDPTRRTALARAMLQVSRIAAGLIEEERAAQAALDDQAPRGDANANAALPSNRPPPLARAQEQPAFGTAADRVADTTRNVLGAVSFPRFVTDLVNGVFRAMLDSTSQQMQMYVDLLNAVSQSAEGFERSQTGDAQVRQWVADHFPEQIEYDTPETEPGETPDPDDVASVRLRLRPGASMPDAEQIRGTLGLGPQETPEAGNPEQLVPLARRTIARQRQGMLATMVQMGMQRIVIDSGRINASMRFHIDTRSVASEDRGSQFGMQNRVKASGSFGVGPWGASAEVENTISYVSTQRSQNTEELNTDLELNSAVELNFRTDYIPLNRLAAQAQADRVRTASLNPVAESQETAADRRHRQDAQRTDDARRRAEVLPTSNPAAAVTATTPARAANPAAATTNPAAAANPTAAANPASAANPAAAANPAGATNPATAGNPASAANPAAAANPASTANPATAANPTSAVNPAAAANPASAANPAAPANSASRPNPTPVAARR